MRVTRFMSRAEWEAFERGETLINTTDHFDGGNGGSKSVGFCFTEDEPAVAWRYLAGVVDADVWATFEFPDNYLTKSDGKYSDKSKGACLFDYVIRTEWCCTSYNSTIAKVVDKCVPFQGDEYREMKAFVNELRSIVL